jgi:hypothetical protein
MSSSGNTGSSSASDKKNPRRTAADPNRKVPSMPKKTEPNGGAAAVNREYARQVAEARKAEEKPAKK